MKKFLLLYFILSFISVSFANDTDKKIVFKDSLNRTISLKSPPKRIVIAGRAGFMITNAALLFKNASSRLLAYPKNSQIDDLSEFYKFPDPKYASKFIVDRDSNVEYIASLKPDLVLLKEFEAPRYRKSFEQLNIPVAFCNLETPDKFFKDIEMLGKIFCDNNRAKRIIKFFSTWQNTVKEKVRAEKIKHPKVLFLFYSERGGGVSFSVSPKHWIQTIMVEMAGGIPVWKNVNLGHGWQKISFDQIATWNPDYIFITSYYNDVNESKKKVMSNMFWKLLKAYKNNHIYAFPKDFVSWDQPDSRWIIGLFWMAMHLDGKVTKDEISDFNKLYNEFYLLYGFDKESIRKIKRSGDLF